MSVHSALGKRHGISEDEIDNLISLDQSKFDYREWLALKYVQDWTFLKGQEPSGDYMSNYMDHYSKKERAYILKLIRTMLFSNYLNNPLKKGVWRSELEGTSVNNSCNIEQNNYKNPV